VVEAGLLEIYRFLPPACLEGFDVETMDFEEFIGYIAKARYIEKLEENLLTRAILSAFSE